MGSQEQLNNEYVRDYYNKQVGSLDEGYTDSRWHSSEAREFDYKQTLRALQKALQGREYTNAVEIGPGDAVWTEILQKYVTGKIHLIEQSDEMLAQAKTKLESVNSSITFERSDFMSSQPPRGVDLIMAIRCFEYFDNKKAALQKIINILAPGGRFVLITKNAKLLTSKNVQGRTVHSGQQSKTEMVTLLQNAGFVVENVYPATLRWKTKYAIARWFFDALHKITVQSGGRIPIPFLGIYATESYTYVALKPVS